MLRRWILKPPAHADEPNSIHNTRRGGKSARATYARGVWSSAVPTIPEAPPPPPTPFAESAAVHLVIDAYNVLHAWRGGPASGNAADELPALARLIQKSGFSSAKATLVCDGVNPGGPHHSGVAKARPDPRARAVAHFAGPGRDADTLIERMIAKDPGVREVTVVSSDRRLQRAARRRGAKFLSAQNFLARAVRDAAGPGPMPDRPAFARKTPLDEFSTRHWLAEFGLPASPGEAEGLDRRVLGEVGESLSAEDGSVRTGGPSASQRARRGFAEGDAEREKRAPGVRERAPGRVSRAPGAPEERGSPVEVRMLEDLAREAVADPELRAALEGHGRAPGDADVFDVEELAAWLRQRGVEPPGS